jgi:hypothetical protein
MTPHCPLCKAPVANVHQIPGPLDRCYYLCSQCKLIFTAHVDLPSMNEEKTRYNEHDNTIEAPGYVKFLNQAIKPALPFLKAQMRGLDYGSGPGPTLSQLLKREGITCEDYDPIFGPDLPEGSFDYIFSTEAFEHFHNPGKEMCQISEILKPGGLLAVMTMFRPCLSEFANWFYAKDYSHVTFFNQETFDYLCLQWHFEHLWDDGKRVILLKKCEVYA